MNADYSFDVDSSRDCIRLRMGGFFAPADLPAFLTARQLAHGRLTCLANTHVTLIDARGLKIQSQEMLEGFGAMLAVPAYHARRLAFVFSPGLLRTQLRRILAGRDCVQCFESVRMAEAWLFAPRAAALIQELVGTEPLRIAS